MRLGLCRWRRGPRIKFWGTSKLRDQRDEKEPEKEKEKQPKWVSMGFWNYLLWQRLLRDLVRWRLRDGLTSVGIFVLLCIFFSWSWSGEQQLSQWWGHFCLSRAGGPSPEKAGRKIYSIKREQGEENPPRCHWKWGRTYNLKVKWLKKLSKLWTKSPIYKLCF